MTTALLVLPEPLPDDLSSAVRRIRHFGDNATVDFHPDAARWLENRRRLAIPGTREQCHEWLALLVLGVNSVTESAVASREIAIWIWCRDLPAFVWCQRTVGLVWDKTPFLPGPGEVKAVLEDYAAPLLAEISGLEKIVATPPPQMIKMSAYVLPRVPDWCFDRTIRKRSLASSYYDNDHDDCPQPKSGSLGSVVDGIVAKHAPEHLDLLEERK